MTPAKPQTPFGIVETTLPDDLAGERLRGLPGRGAALVERVFAQIEREAHDEAGATLAALLTLTPGHPEVLRAGAGLDIRGGAPRRAIPLLQRVLAERPDDTFAYNDLGEALRASGQLDAAYAAWRGACERRPDSVAAWYNLAWNLDRDGRFAEASEALARVAELAPDFAAARMMLGDILVMLGQTGRAAEEYRAAVRASPGFGEAWCNLSNMRSVRFDSDEIARMEQADRRPDLSGQ